MVARSVGLSVTITQKGWKFEVKLPCSYRSTRYQPCPQYFLRIFEHWSKIWHLKASYKLNLSWLFSVKLIVDMNCWLIIVPISFVFLHFFRCLLEILLLYESLISEYCSLTGYEVFMTNYYPSGFYLSQNTGQLKNVL